jgi:hypothetical protein
MTGKDMVVLDSYRGWSEVEIMFYSGYPRSHFLTRRHRQSRLIYRIGKMRPRYLITGPGGRAWDLVQNEDILSRLGAEPILLQRAGKQNIYSLAPVGGQGPETAEAGI